MYQINRIGTHVSPYEPNAETKPTTQYIRYYQFIAQ